MQRLKSTNMDHIVKNRSRSPTSMRSRTMYKASSNAPAKKVRFATKVQQKIIPLDDLDSSSSHNSEETYVDPLEPINAGSPSRRQGDPLIVSKPSHTKAPDSMIRCRSQIRPQLNASQQAQDTDRPKIGKRLSVAEKPIFEKPLASEPALGSSLPHNRRACVVEKRELGKEHLEPIVVYWPNLLSYRRENQNGTAVLRSHGVRRNGLGARTIKKRPSLGNSCVANMTKQKIPKSKVVRTSKHRSGQDMKHDVRAKVLFRDV